MCGIVALIAAGELPVDHREIVVAMRDSLAHRGPDDATFGQYDGWVALGHRRLSVVDVAGSKQPLESEDGSVVCIFNGELYNFRALRDELVARGHRFRTDGDGETIVHGYEEWGADVLLRLEGMFALVLVDRHRGVAFVARDRFGIKPVFWTRCEGALLVASELKALLAHPRLDRFASQTGLALGALRMHTPWPYTAFDGVFRLPPGAAIRADRRGGLELSRYAPIVRTRRAEAPPVVESAHRVLLDAVRRQVMADVPVGAFLSGGIDSTLIVALMRELGVAPLHTFSLGVDRSADDESSIARSTARRLGTIHHEFRMEELAFEDLVQLPALFDEPFAETSAIGVFALSRLARGYVKVALSGDGGDEVFGGYDTYRIVQAARCVQLWLPELVSQTIGDASRRAIAGQGHGTLVRRASRLGMLFALHPAAAQRATSSLIWSELDSGAHQSERLSASITGVAQIVDAAPNAFRLAMCADRLERLPNAMLTKVDIASMAASLEVRVPMLDDRVVEFADRLPTTAIATPRWGKLVLRRLLESILPDGPAWHRKRGFALPLDAWMHRPSISRQMGTLLRDARGRVLELTGIDPSSAWSDFRAGTARWSSGTAAMRLLWLATVALWADRFKPGAARDSHAPLV